MDEDLRVDPVGVRAAGKQVDEQAESFLAGHVAANERIAAAQNGFIGESAAALAGLAAHWKEESASHHRELRQHGEDLLAAAAKYETADTDAATTLDAAASDVAERMGI
ncbi:hypothetical protein MSP7336_00369 [Mycobacterium shimoidei]|uniref:Uncharacterized protein n=1 Tax=Mycobacterium shimoidei TaxID=29313 RepID=A0A375YTR2_MYCSH|nr:WXG100 family type VII secretion target [Mycobacterium shimoidei]SRX92145.1 hypothetical protein MSP7336_00369 [Mycobacterium shimoidei]